MEEGFLPLLIEEPHSMCLGAEIDALYRLAVVWKAFSEQAFPHLSPGFTGLSSICFFFFFLNYFIF